MAQSAQRTSKPSDLKKIIGNNINNLDDKYMHLAKDISFKPIFILGHQRTGTTILYKMLGKTEQFNNVTIYHILKYDELLYNHIKNRENKVKKDINSFFKKSEIKNRSIDKIKVESDCFHDYGYIFSKKKFPKKLSYKSKDLFEKLCKKIIFVSKNNKPILLKNPFDYSNFLLLKKMYPDAKFIFIHRNPYEVVSSMMRAARVLYENKVTFATLFDSKYNQIFDSSLQLNTKKLLYASRFPLGILGTISSYAKESDFFLRNMKYLPDEDYISVRYEDLCYCPNEIICKIMNFLNLNYEKKDFSRYIKPRKLELTRETKIFMGMIYQLMEPYFKWCAYDYN